MSLGVSFRATQHYAAARRAVWATMAPRGRWAPLHHPGRAEGLNPARTSRELSGESEICDPLRCVRLTVDERETDYGFVWQKGIGRAGKLKRGAPA
jgi:hypothetical protein